MPETGFRKWIITFTVILAAVIELIDTTIVNVALPQMMGNLGATLDEITWVVTAYVVANVIVVPMTGWLASVFGRRNYFAGSIALFTIASMFCGHASGIWELVVFRFIQGLGGGALMATSQSILVETFPREEMGLASALFGLGVVSGPTIGPTLGGWITDNFSWPWIFYVNLPIGILAALLTLLFVREPRHERRRSGAVDWPGIALLVIGIGALQVVLERGQRLGWFESREIVLLALAAAAGLIGFVARELTAEHPVVDLRLFRDRSLAVGSFFTFVIGFGLFATVFIFPVFAQHLLGFTALQTGLLMLPGTLTTAFMMPFVGKMLQRKVPPQLLCAFGFTLFAISNWTLSRSTLASGPGDFFWPLVLRGAGLSLLFVPITTAALWHLKPADIPQGTGLTNMLRQLGGSFGVAIVATYVERENWSHRADLITHLSLYQLGVRTSLESMVRGFMSRGSTLFDAQRQAQASLEGLLTRQTYLLSYMDAFLAIAVFLLVCLPLLLLFRRGAGSAGAPPGIH